MPSEHRTFINENQQKIAYSIYTPTAPARAIIFIVHGYGEHRGRYAHVAEAFNHAGYLVYTIDHRGHGESEGERVYFDSFDQPATDLYKLFDMAKATHPDLPRFVFGHSMGSVISLCFALKHQGELKGLLLTGTATNIEDASSGAVIAIGTVVAKLFPKLRFIPPLPIETLSTDPQVWEDYKKDPLNDAGIMRGSLAMLMITTGRTLRARAHELTLPLCVMHGGDDKLTPISGSHAIYNGAGSQDKTLKIYEGMRHELINEREKGTVIADMLAWFEARL